MVKLTGWTRTRDSGEQRNLDMKLTDVKYVVGFGNRA